MSNIILIGMRGSGKTTIGKKVAKKLKMDFIDTDAEIEKYANKSIANIVAEDGWETFREHESHVCREVGGKTNTVLATGAGVILNPKNITALTQDGNGICIFLDIPLRILVSRLKNNRGDHRPSLTKNTSFLDEVRHVHRERYPKYCQAADYICKKISVREILEFIIQKG